VLLIHIPISKLFRGGGIGGMSLALCLNKLIANHESHLQIDIYESANSLQAQVGAGIGVWPFAWVVFEELGIADELLTLALKPPTEEPGKSFRNEIQGDHLLIRINSGIAAASQVQSS
jgi:hypothetical protein